jgi:hypothetical protein
MLANGGWDLTLVLVTWTTWRAPTNASKWRMGLNSAFKTFKSKRIKLFEDLNLERKVVHFEFCLNNFRRASEPTRQMTAD